MKKFVTIILSSLCAIILGIGILNVIRVAIAGISDDSSQGILSTSVEKTKDSIGEIIHPEKKTLDLLFVGDIMMDRGVESSVTRNHSNDFNLLFKNTSSYIQGADISFANLEGQVSDIGSDQGKKYSFHMNPVVLSALTNAGFDIVSVANNHMLDWGFNAFKDTLHRLDENKIAYTGGGTKEVAERVTIIEQDGIKVGYLGYTDVGPSWQKPTETVVGINAFSKEEIVEIITNNRPLVDILIVSVHWGEEYQTHKQHQTELAHAMIDAGADIIAGHHPHVIQDTEEYNGGLIAYSLGNFMFDQYFSKETLEGLMLFVTVSKDGIESHTKLKSTQDKTYAIIKVEPFQKTTENRIEDVEKVSCETPEITPVEDNLLFPIGRITKLGSYVPSNLVDIRESISTIGNKFICMTSIATEQLDALSVEIEKTGLKIIPVSGYRSKSYQKTLFEAWRKQFTITPPYFAVAEPEHSEHQLGTTVDLMSGTQELADFEKFGTSAEYVWMKEHAHEFGFVQSYTKGTEEITGYIEEAWHWRYVGTEIATDIKEQGITLTEYLQQN